MQIRPPGDEDPDATRVLKLRVPAQLVRDMDAAILASKGTYFDRNEFVTEAIWDRLAEEGLSPDRSPRESDQSADAYWRLADVLTCDPPTADSSPQIGHNFGLHNRDLPSLWALADLMLALAGDIGDWPKFAEGVRGRAQAVGRWLRAQDSQTRAAVKASVGFPREGAKSRASEDRFLSTAIGNPRTRQGPAFLMGLISVTHEGSTDVRPTPQAVALMGDLVKAGLSQTLPQPESATEQWLRHLREVCPEEFAAWVSVLRALLDTPTRGDLVDLFPQWPGTQADTNCMGYISRGREWGLVRAELADGRYELTDLGHQVVTKESNANG